MTFKKGDPSHPSKNQDVWNKGKPWSQEVKTNISLGKRGLINQPQLCGCGCGKLTKRGRKYIHGHNLRVKNPSNDPNVRVKISNSTLGRHYSQRTEFKKGNIPWWIQRGLPHPSRDPTVIDKIKLYRLKQNIPKKDTVIEIKLRDALTEAGFIFDKHYPIIGQPDIAFPEQKVAVFCDGCYWHGCSVCGFDTLRPNHDERVTSQLEGKGWTVLRFWEHEIKENEQECVRQIEQVLG